MLIWTRFSIVSKAASTRPEPSPDFLLGLVGSTNFMRSRRAGTAYATMDGYAYRKSASSRAAAGPVRQASAILYFAAKLVLIVPALWGYSSAGRAPRSQRGGQRFDPA